jgi:hypothetical protein
MAAGANSNAGTAALKYLMPSPLSACDMRSLTLHEIDIFAQAVQTALLQAPARTVLQAVTR